MDPNGIDVKLGRFGLNEKNILYAMTTTEFPDADDPGELSRWATMIDTQFVMNTWNILIRKYLRDPDQFACLLTF